MPDEPTADSIDHQSILRIVDEVEDEVLAEDKTWASRDQIAEGTCARIRNRICSVDTDTDHSEGRVIADEQSESDFGHLFDPERKQLEDIFGEDWQDCITPYGANKLLSTLSEARAKQPDEIADGDECPVCGDPIRNAHDVLEDMDGESIEVEKVCISEFPNNSVIHFDDERVEAPEEQATNGRTA